MRDNVSHIVQLRRALHLAGTDTLTGLHNRHAFEQAVSTLDERPFLLVLMDLDGLKTVNDSLGHAQGDELLRSFARLLRDMENEHITAYRLGGDEFALIAPPEEEAALVSRLRVAEKELRSGGFPTSGLSVGVAQAGATALPVRCSRRPTSACTGTNTPRRPTKVLQTCGSPGKAAVPMPGTPLPVRQCVDCRHQHADLYFPPAGPCPSGYGRHQSTTRRAGRPVHPA
ncbi:GGDEF domain-containing protein [Deinococcus malanensis]|uniref:GGDEF domain-containing protein n=1 Tax=Deinococcus malanensis TaxID=1706855 RepID=UPI00363AE4C9